MSDYRTTETVERVPARSSGGTILLVVLVLAALVVGFLFATGFFSANVTKPGELPSVSVKADAGSLPDVDVHSKEVVVGTKPTTVEVPTVQTKKATVDVPVVGVKN